MWDGGGDGNLRRIPSQDYCLFGFQAVGSYIFHWKTSGVNGCNHVCEIWSQGKIYSHRPMHAQASWTTIDKLVDKTCQLGELQMFQVAQLTVF